ncbi:MAG TPA: sulfate adenylyltransferase [Actinomycetota bacterium]|nr:sulfate adenylyltransferase [Actinomycetota bacterium]
MNKPDAPLRLASPAAPGGHPPPPPVPLDGSKAYAKVDFGPPPHGGVLASRLAGPEERDRWLDQVPVLNSVTLTAREAADIECLAVGAFSPLEGFMGKADYRSVVADMRLANGLVWSLPVTLAATAEEVLLLKKGGDVVLRDPQGEPLAILHLDEIFAYDREEEAESVFRTSEAAHPGVAALLAQGEWLLGGTVTVLRLPRGRPLVSYRLTPREVRRAVADRGWRTVVGFQTRNPIHRAHEYLTKCALEQVDGLLLHPLAGESTGDDVPADIRMRSYEALMAGYYPHDRVLLSVFVAAMRYAGPREAVFHALCRKNYGCTHFMVGRDHAGVGNYYGTFDAQDIFGEFTAGELGIEPMFFDDAFWCTVCGGMATAKTCPHGPGHRVTLPGAEVRRRLSSREPLPHEFIRPEVAEVLRAAFADDDERRRDAPVR